ncbi:hypothetical protein WISP_122569 [Willisornis vidua]|uniref:Uncharacterized protein n=1 Tax=Willisornis vidua TaxID=1566151 RepID=A0ABQ9CXW9_9PASS|nr:hypothetical protein WISP_122569 [Willisornis vidua]
MPRECSGQGLHFPSPGPRSSAKGVVIRRDRDKDRERERERDWDREWDRDQHKDWDRNQDNDWDKDQDKDWDKDQDRGQDKDRDKVRGQSPQPAQPEQSIALVSLLPKQEVPYLNTIFQPYLSAQEQDISR